MPGPQNQADFVQVAYNGPPIPLHIGTEYFIVVEFFDLNVAWLNDGSSSQPFFSSTDSGIRGARGPPNLSNSQSLEHPSARLCASRQPGC